MQAFKGRWISGSVWFYLKTQIPLHPADQTIDENLLDIGGSWMDQQSMARNMHPLVHRESDLQCDAEIMPEWLTQNKDLSMGRKSPYFSCTPQDKWISLLVWSVEASFWLLLTLRILQLGPMWRSWWTSIRVHVSSTAHHCLTGYDSIYAPIQQTFRIYARPNRVNDRFFF